ncbi:hypothetical protein LJY25_19415 [Hymenobacter sp. BT175]|uniref:hypothetical protein n=1 Tax=Hymenobacter translucens TaxID=2886507 RepID=UPI001D0E3148|nr:hypothetical protein [Hymenobacter translucens]MCC2548626.1 hypothetical protein [Hymenobacter translucens]
MLLRRRHRRLLLLPPGLLALAFLLLLGCRQVSLHAERLNLRHTLELNLDPVGDGHAWQELQILPWRTVAFTGNIWLDYFSAQETQAMVRHIKARSFAAGGAGLRVQFSTTAKYSSLIRVLDCLHQVKLNNWWLEVNDKPTTLYAMGAYRLE